MTNRAIRGGVLRLITDEEIERIHTSSLEILEQVGIQVKSSRITRVFRDGGAEIDADAERVRIPEYLVREALSKTPSRIMLCGRSPRYDVCLEKNRIYFGMGGTPTPFIRDVETGEFRRPTKKDFADATRLGDALPNMSFLMAISGVFDVPYQTEYLHEYEVMFSNTEKPIIYPAPGSVAAKGVLEMATAISGGMDELRRRPILSLYVETVSPLVMFGPDETFIDGAEAGIPITLGPGPIMGAAAPGTIAGTVLVANCENLAAMTLTQLVKKGAPIIYTCGCSTMDPRTCRVLYGAPELTMGGAVIGAQLARYYGLPCFGWAGVTDSKVPDAQAGAEVMMTSLLNALAGINLMHDCGYLASGSVGSMEMAVICDDIAGMVSRIVRGVDINDETLAVDLIRSIGPGGNFLGEKHTLEFIGREIFLPKILDRTDHITWERRGRKDIGQIARERVKQILKEHNPQPLPKDVQEKLSLIVKKCEKELVAAEK